MVNNKLNGGRGASRSTVAALILAFVFTLSALVTGLVFGLKKRERTLSETPVARYLLADAAEGLNHTLSAMRLCVETETARELGKTALVYAVRAETALECDLEAWDACACKEAFLNDVATILHTKQPIEAVALSHEMFRLSTSFLEHVKSGAHFEYNGELTAGDKPEDTEQPGEAEPSEEAIAQAAERIKRVLGTGEPRYIGSYSGRIEFDVERGGYSGYAVVDGERIAEFSFSHSGSGAGSLDRAEAVRIALECADSCGYGGLSVHNVDIKNDFAVVRLCREIDGAMCCDEYASAAVVGGEAVAFTAGKSGGMHKLPAVRCGEERARKQAPGAESAGTLVSRVVGGRERVCYEYRYELEDGVHFVYVCAESGRQMQVK